MTRFSVLLDDPEALALRFKPVARVVATVLGEPVADAKLRVRYGGGIVARAVAPGYAKQIARGLALLGLGSFTLAEPAFRAAPRPRRVGAVAVAEESLELAVRGRPPQTFPWAQVEAVYVWGLLGEPGSDERDSLGWGPVGSVLPADAQRLSGAVTELEQRERARLQLGADLLVGEALFRVSFDEPGIYAGLAERGEHTLDNFLRLVRALLDAAPDSVLVPPSAVRFAEAALIDRVVRSKREELDAFTAWVINAAAAGVRFDEEPEDLADDSLQDADEAIVVGPGGDLEAEELDDADLEEDGDALDDEDDEADEDDEDGEDGEADEADEADEDDEDGEDDEDDQDDQDDDLVDDDLDDDPATGDADLSEVLEHFAQTDRFDKGTLAAMLDDAEELELGDDAEEGVADAEVAEAMGFFDVSSGSWNVSRLLEESDALGVEDVES